MAISEKARQELQQKLDEVLGPKDAWALMEEVSGRDWGELATKVDLDHLGALTRRDIEGLEGRMDARFEGLEGRMDARFQAVDSQFEALGARLEGTLGRELGNLYKEVAAHTRTTVFACIAAVMTATGVALASARL